MGHLRQYGGVRTVDRGLRRHLHVTLSREVGLGGPRHALVLRLRGGGGLPRPHPRPPPGLRVHAPLGLDGARAPMRRDPLVRRLQQGVDLLGRGLGRPAMVFFFCRFQIIMMEFLREMTGMGADRI